MDCLLTQWIWARQTHSPAQASQALLIPVNSTATRYLALKFLNRLRTILHHLPTHLGCLDTGPVFIHQSALMVAMAGSLSPRDNS